MSSCCLQCEFDNAKGGKGGPWPTLTSEKEWEALTVVLFFWTSLKTNVNTTLIDEWKRKVCFFLHSSYCRFSKCLVVINYSQCYLPVLFAGTCLKGISRKLRAWDGNLICSMHRREVERFPRRPLFTLQAHLHVKVRIQHLARVTGTERFHPEVSNKPELQRSTVPQRQRHSR